MDHSIFVGDLAVDVTDQSLQDEFRKYFPSVRGAKVITDMVSNRSKGYGFVRFGDEDERNRSITEMQGHIISGRPVRVSVATAKKPATYDRPQTTPTGQGEDVTNTTLFIGALSSSVTEEELKGHFARYGPVVYCKVPSGGSAPKNCAFVQFVNRSSAEHAMQEMHGQVLGGSAIRVSWGRNNSRPYTQQPSAASSIAHYPAGMYAPSVPAYPHYPVPAVDPYAAYHAMALPAVDPYNLQGYQQRPDASQQQPGQAAGQSTPAGSVPVEGRPDQGEISRRNAASLQRNRISLQGHVHRIIDSSRTAVH